MEFSQTHQRFSDYLKNPEALDNPEKFLGPNWRTVLNFWLYLDKLTDEQRKELGRRYWALNDDTLNKARVASHTAAEEVIGRTNSYAAYWASLTYCKPATYELIAMHKLLDSGISLTFFPLFHDL